MLFDNTKGYNWIFNIIALSLIFIAILFLVYPTSALENYTIVERNSTDTTISWDIGYISEFRPIAASFDGVNVENFQLQYNNTYTVSDLAPNTVHTFCLYDNTSINCMVGNTTSSKEPINQIASVFYSYIWAIIAIVLIVVSAYFKIKEIAMVAFIFGVIGFASVSSADGIGMVVHGLIMGCAISLTFIQE